MEDYISAIVKAGGEVYVVGGAVRNYIYNYFHSTIIPIKDYDFVVRLLDEDEIITTLKPFGFIKKVGKSFGIILFNDKKNNLKFGIS